MLQIDREKLLKELRKLNPKKVGLQFPEGLKSQALEIADLLDYEVYIYGGNTYGACDVADEELRFCDCLVHFGHAEIPLKFAIPVLFVEVFDDIDLVPSLKKNLDYLEKKGKKIGLATTVQHIPQLKNAESFLRSSGFNVYIGEGTERIKYEGQVLGCNFSVCTSIEDKVNYFLYVGTGYFHPLGISLNTGKEVFLIDPYAKKIENLEHEKAKLLKKRYALIEKAKSAEKFGLIVSTRKGQFRMKEALCAKKEMEKLGKKAYIFLTREISPEKLRGFDLDAYVICACPRIAIDDQLRYDVPVLTVSEVSLMSRSREYEFDVIGGS
ncbi:MAG: diphthamide biosynthesis enzyme Dph2 [Methanomicrobia archaeon]|nr:diphthamide biosynthesis enzyme Dph2 [Methanomicrobia archaeon]MCK4636443.1 diphthamide biosynthesis enzyme Dph2 [Methanomicrobia archaeon]